jgi:hypothetical protein
MWLLCSTFSVIRGTRQNYGYLSLEAGLIRIKGLFGLEYNQSHDFPCYKIVLVCSSPLGEGSCRKHSGGLILKGDELASSLRRTDSIISLRYKVAIIKNFISKAYFQRVRRENQKKLI